MSGDIVKILCINTNGLHNDGITNSILTYYFNMDKSNMQIDLLKTKDIDSSTEEKVAKSGTNLCFTDYRKNVLPYIIKTARFIRTHKYDIVHAHGSSAILSIDLLAAFLGGCKVRIAHSRNTKCDHRFIDKILRPFFYALCTERFACGEEAGKWLFGDRTFKVIKNAKNLEKFAYDEETRLRVRRENCWENKTVYGHVGNFNYQKNHEFLIELFSKIIEEDENSVLVLMGTGNEYLEKAQMKVKELGLQNAVVFLGSVNNVYEYLQAMDVMLFPSRFEGLPNVVLEWQIAGLPAIISDKITKECGITDLVKYVSIDKGIAPWIKEISAAKILISSSDRKSLSKGAKIDLKKAGFDISESATLLKQYYIESVESRK